MTTPTDTQLKQALAKMLPDVLEPKWVSPTAIGTNINDKYFVIWWKGKATAVLDAELLHLCGLVGGTINEAQKMQYGEIMWDLCDGFLDYSGVYYEGETPTMDYKKLFPVINATWQQRTIALAKVKGIEII